MSARFALLLALLLAGCASGPRIDTTYTAKSQDSRAQFIIIHFTTGTFAGSLKWLTEGPVSSHYLVSREPVVVYRLVDESRRAYHAGVSSWQGMTALNAGSIGIEIDNVGLVDKDTQRYQDFPPEQIARVIELVRDIARRHQVPPQRILGHNEIAPTRRTDPGPAFPWTRLADAGLVAWPDVAAVDAQRVRFEADAELPPVGWFQEKLARVGYALPRSGELDGGTRDALVAFQMRYRPRSFSGAPDAETAALLEVITTPGGLLLTGPDGVKRPYKP
ncbi:MAG: N-acetylmuramoyl-L-alanine amidase [Burkholderiales bacterium]|nr:N-acetylmuramoyl-L-alanine amidase [Burkholderiales bacterium]